MATLTVRNVPDDTVKALKVAAAKHGRSMEAAVRALIGREYASSPRITAEEAQRRFAALWDGSPPENMVDRFLAERKEEWDD